MSREYQPHPANRPISITLMKPAMMTETAASSSPASPIHAAIKNEAHAACGTMTATARTAVDCFRAGSGTCVLAMIGGRRVAAVRFSRNTCFGICSAVLAIISLFAVHYDGTNLGANLNDPTYCFDISHR